MSESRARLFVAADLPDGVREQLYVWTRSHLTRTPQLRPVGNLHVTLCFLGWREEAEIEALARMTATCVRAAAELSLGGLAWLPPGRPRVVAVDLVDGRGQLGALQRTVSHELEAGAGYEPERRPFRPHVTVARVRSGARLPPRTRPRPPPLPSARFRAGALTLHRSRRGAGYEAVARVQLP